MQTLATTTELRAIIRKVLNKHSITEYSTWTNPSTQYGTRHICIAYGSSLIVSKETLAKKINKKLAKNNFKNKVKVNGRYIRAVAQFSS
jgi:hypothetical protein